MSQSFEDKVKSMKSHEIIMAMVRGLQKGHIEVDMDTYGSYYCDLKKCFGCAATNTVCEISGIIFNEDNIRFHRENAIDSSLEFLDIFEKSIDYLRRGLLCSYNACILKISPYSVIDEYYDGYLPSLLTDNYKNNLEPYIKLAEHELQRNSKSDDCLADNNGNG